METIPCLPCFYNADSSFSLPPPSAGCHDSNGDVTPGQYQWGVLGLSVLIAATAVGNLLVCLAVAWERRLQNMTNYFLTSLAIADLLVALLVMPLGMVVELYGKSTYNTVLLIDNVPYSSLSITLNLLATLALPTVCL